MKKLTFIASVLAVTFLTSCGGGEQSATATDQGNSSSTEEKTSNYDPKRGLGKFTAESITISDKLDVAMATTGESIAEVKCTSCHKATEEKLVGPGWKGVTTRRTPEWIMNFITNPDPMIDKDPTVQALLEICLVRMPNQNLSDDEARSILEYMRKINGVN